MKEIENRSNCGMSDQLPHINPLPDVIKAHLTVLFCGVNPGMLAAETGHHFAGRNNRFWRAVYLAGFTAEEIAPQNDISFLQYGCGLSSVVARPTPRADQVSRQEFAKAADTFELKIKQNAPRFVAFLGKAAYAALYDRREITWGAQSNAIGKSRLWVLPNPSGRNRAFSLDRLVENYRQLYEIAFEQCLTDL